jgi:hypothetical protein
MRMPRARRQSYQCRLNVLGSIRVPVVVVKTGVVGVSRSGWSLLPAGAFAGTLLMVERGRPIRRWRAARGGVGDGAGSSAGLGTVEGPIFALMGLLIAFTFSGAASRLDGRRQLIVQEANDIGTAYLDAGGRGLLLW